MKTETITYYVASDGARFTTPSAREAHESLKSKISEILKPLAIPTDARAALNANKGYWQHDLEKVYAAREGILQLCREAGYDHAVFKKHGRDVHPLSFVGRLLDDSDGPLNTAWRTFAPIDDKGREWQQCFHAYTEKEEWRNAQPCLNP